MNIDCVAIVLAAGEGKRMKPKSPKALHMAAGRPLTGWVVDAAGEATGAQPVLVIGNGADAVREYFGDTVRYAVQERQLGSGHAVMAARSSLTGDGYAIVVAGDMPLIRAETLRRIARRAQEKALGACLLTAVVDDPTGYGRVLREGAGVRIVQEGAEPKFRRSIRAISFSAEHALAAGHRVLYITERCVFELTAAGLRLAEVYPGVDAEGEIRALLDFPLA